MDFTNYQIATRKTAVYPPNQGVTYCAIGLANEAGEAIGPLKKVLRGDKGLDDVIGDLKAELGDVLWYVARLADELGLDLAEIAEYNVYKLADRASRGVIRGDGDSR